jgi:pyruvate dehydrogenase E2 component (dihydrolipoamide acetyltransferase)
MAENIYLPRLGQTMTEGTVVEWLKKDGESVKKGEEIYTLEYDKATINVESPADGTLNILVAADETVNVGTIVGRVLGENETAEAADGSEKEEPEKETEEAGSGRSAAARGVRISPIAKKLAQEYGVDITKVKAGDPSGRISKEDIQRYKEESAGGAKGRKEPLTAMRKVISQRMAASAFTAPHVTYSTDADLTGLTALRAKLNAGRVKEEKISFTDLIIKAVATALKDSPNINIRLEGETVSYLSEINVGVAVAVENGLVVPVIAGADRLSVGEISLRTKELAKKARENALRPEDMTGGTFTVTNLGMYGIDMFTPIINQPESAILGIGRIIGKPVAADKKIEIRPMMVLSLSADHRVIDGAPAAQFLGRVKEYIEQPKAIEGGR